MHNGFESIVKTLPSQFIAVIFSASASHGLTFAIYIINWLLSGQRGVLFLHYLRWFASASHRSQRSNSTSAAAIATLSISDATIIGIVFL